MSIVQVRSFPWKGFGEHLTQARLRLGLSQEKLAEAIGTTARSISRWEHNQAIPWQYYRERLCEVLQTTPEARFGGDKEEQQGVEKQTPLWHVPYPRKPYFTGREDILYQLHERLHQEHQIALTQPQIMSGLGGIGKTQTALEYLYRFRDDYQTVLWVGAETPEILMADYRNLAHLFQLPEKDSSDQILLREAIKRWFHSHANWLLVFDNVEDMEQLHIMLPDARQGHILITTRSQITGSLGFHIDLQKMELAEGALFLLRRAKLLQPGVDLEDVPPLLLAQANTLVELLDGLPLALDQAGAYIEETACSLSDYLERYATRRAVLLSARGTLSNHHPDSVTATLVLAIQQIEQKSPAADLLHLCAFLHADAIPEEFFVQIREVLSIRLQSISDDPLLLDEAIRELRRFSLLHRDAETKTLSIHRLLQASIQDEMGREEQKEWIERITRAMLQVFPNYENAELSHSGGIQPSYQRYLPHALTCAAAIKAWEIVSEEAGALLFRVSYYFQVWGDFPQAMPLMLHALEIARTIWGEEHGKTAWYLHQLAVLYKNSELYTQAETCLQQALAIQERVEGTDHPRIAEMLGSLADTFCITGRYRQAIAFAQRALTINEHIFGPDHYRIAMVLNLLGANYKLLGEYTLSEALLQRGLLIYEKTLGREHFFIASCLKNLADVYSIQAEYQKAIALYRQALQICEKRLGPYHSLTAEMMKRLGIAYFGQNQYHQTQRLYQRALLVLEKTQKRQSVQAASILIHLGELHLIQGHSAQARSYLQHACLLLGTTVEIEQADDQKIIMCLRFVADHFRDRGQLALAHIYYQRAAAWAKSRLGADHFLTAQCDSSLAAILTFA